MKSNLQEKLNNYLAVDGIFQTIYAYTRTRFEADKRLTAHNWEHARRDVLNSIAIGEAEGADMTIVLPAMVMHDIGFLYGAVGKTHAALGAEKLPEFLQDGGIDLGSEMVAAMAACIRTHKGSAHNEQPESLEAKVVSDADVLEKLGPVGVYQLIRTFTEFNYDARLIIQRLRAADDRVLQTETGQVLAEERGRFGADFAEALAAAYRPYEDDEEHL